jgi:hypothetical protein
MPPTPSTHSPPGVRAATIPPRACLPTIVALLVACPNPGDTTTTASTTATTTASTTASDSTPTSSTDGEATKFSFFVTSYKALQNLSGGPQGFGGDLRFGETGPGAGLRGADKICATIAEQSLPGAGAKQWRAFLSASADAHGDQVDAIDRIGEGPWYDRLGRTFANSKADLMAGRPTSADPLIKDDFPNEDGVPNHQPDPNQDQVDNHDMLTGTGADGKLFDKTATCLDWTSALGDVALEGKPRVGHSWIRTGDGMMMHHETEGPMTGFPGTGGPMTGPPDTEGPMTGGIITGPPDTEMGTDTLGDDINNWMSSLTESGCAPGVNLIETGPPMPDEVTVGSGGGYGGFYCFALTP